jgi:hypothetical protein
MPGKPFTTFERFAEEYLADRTTTQQLPGRTTAAAAAIEDAIAC